MDSSNPQQEPRPLYGSVQQDPESLATPRPSENPNSLENFASSYTRAQSFAAYDSAPTLIGSSMTQDFRDVDVFDDESETEPLLVPPQQLRGERRKSSIVITGRSTAPQTIFNSVNVLVGVGMLSLSLGLAYTGWIVGVVIFSFFAVVTFMSAKWLAECMDGDHTVVTYADIAYRAYGSNGRMLVAILFSLELLGACVSVTILFADSVNALYPLGDGGTIYKLVFGLLMIPSSLMPLSVLSFGSIVGIASTIGMVLAVLLAGLVKNSAPGSLLTVMSTPMLPPDWSKVPLAFGIFMAPWGGHTVFPNIYRDMRHPAKYGSCLSTTYIITYLIDIGMAILGFLMFGLEVKDEVTKSILLTKGYPLFLGVALTFLTAIVPISKGPLTLRPIICTVEALMNIKSQVSQLAVRIVIVAVIVFLSIVFPQFDKIIGLLGSGLITLICVVGPILFHKRIIGGHGIWDSILIFIFLVIGVSGSAWCIAYS